MASCGLLNFMTCLPEAFFSYLAGILGAPLQPLLSLVSQLLSLQVNVSLFSSIWAIMIYIISMFYALLLLYSGFQFMISGHDIIKRENAKEWLRNIIIMIVLVQASYFIYELFVQISSALTSATLSFAGTQLFVFKATSMGGIAFQLIYYLFAIFSMIITTLMLIIRYVIVAVGVVLFPLGIFFYFIPILRSYGLLIMNFLGIAVFITFIDAIVLIGFSKILEISIFSNISLIVIISAFMSINVLMFFLMFFSILKATFNVGMKAVALGTKVVAMVA